MKNQPGTMKNLPGTMKNHKNRPRIVGHQPGTMNNHKNRPGTMKKQTGTVNCETPCKLGYGWSRVIMSGYVGYGGYRRLQGGSDDFS